MSPDVSGTTSPVRLLLVDDHEIARAGLRGLLADEPDFVVVAEAEDGRDALAACELHQPDVVLMDIRLPGLNGLVATREIIEAHPKTRVVMVSVLDQPEYVAEARAAGASGYVLKDARKDEIAEAIRRAARGTEGFAMSFTNGRVREEAGRGLTPLSRREREVLRLLARGCTNPEIGRELGVTAGTVKIHVQHIMAKLLVTDRTQAAVRAYELGLLDDRAARLARD